MAYQAGNFNWTGRGDSQADERIYQCVQLLDLNQNIPDDALVMLGFKSDEGIRRNLGRVGAKEGPDAIRQSLGGMAKHHFSKTIYDAGDVEVDGQDLEASQAQLASLVKKIHDQNNKLIMLGGGHEISWPHYKGLYDAYLGKRVGIINFDSHFDLRKPGQAGPSSGTPFWQAHEVDPNGFRYCVFGIQPYANTRTLYDTAKQFNVAYYEQDQITSEAIPSLKTKIDQFLATIDVLYLTICLDVFDITIAPGVSAPSTRGMLMNQAEPLLSHIIQHEKCRSVDIAELSPCHDQREKTARLAAWLCHSMIEQGFSK